MRIIRPALEKDLPRILEIERACFKNPWPESLLRGHLGESGFLVYEKEGRVVGYVIAGLKIPSFWARLERQTRALIGQPVDWEEQTGHIMNLAVEPSQQRQGLGEALLRQALKYLKGLGAYCVELEVRASNQAAIRLYEKHGFRVKERLRSYYGPGEDGLLMVKPLKQPA